MQQGSKRGCYSDRLESSRIVSFSVESSCWQSICGILENHQNDRRWPKDKAYKNGKKVKFSYANTDSVHAYKIEIKMSLGDFILLLPVRS